MLIYFRFVFLSFLGTYSRIPAKTNGSFLFKAPCQVELENWVNSIHSACAAAFARHRGKTGTLHLLQEEIFRLEKAIESVSNYRIK